MRRRPAVSVVIPSYNHDRFIAEALDSVRVQSLPVGDIVVVDDGSTDDSVDVVERHASESLRLIRQENRGAHAAINRAIEESVGDWVAVLNSDDVYDPEWIEAALAIARAKGAGLVFGSIDVIDAEGSRLGEDHPIVTWYRDAVAVASGETDIRRAIRPHNLAVTTSNFFFHRSLWESLGGFSAYRYVHDYDFLLRAAEADPERVWFADGVPSVRYRIHEANTIAESEELALAERKRMLAAFDSLSRRAGVRLGGGARRHAMRRAVERSVSSLTPRRPGSTRGEDGRPRVGLVVESLDRGGLEEVVAMLADALPDHGMDVRVLCTRERGEVAERLDRGGVRVDLAKSGPEQAGWVAMTRPDVLSTHYVGLEAIAELARGGVPIVETVHNAYGWLDADGWAAEREKAAHLSAVVGVSETAAEYYRRHTETTLPVTVIPNAVDPIRAAALPKVHARKLFALAAEAPVFVHVGRLVPSKNVEGLLDAFAELVAELPDATLVLAGARSDRAALRALRRRHAGLFERDRVRALPHQAAVGALMAAADAYVGNSFLEGWSLAASEALWVGLPAILSHTGGAAELVGADGERGRLIPNPAGDPLAVTPDRVTAPPAAAVAANRSQLLDAMRSVTANRSAWAAAAPSIRAWARSELTIDRMAAAHAAILHEIAGSDAPTRSYTQGP